ncbi:MAG: acyl-CoA dehydrogenase family protein [Candidatus Obscuribacterales bacterium]|nr:acyl-CoA dehydrogenase family protein [Candidatus Obscuribacterales bacterium]
MTDLVLSQESKEYQALARDFFQNEVASKSEKLDHEGKFPEELYKAAFELGLASSYIPEAYGGLGLPLWDCAVMAEEAGSASGGLAAVFEGNFLAAAAVILSGTDKQKEEYLSSLCTEAGLAGFCFNSKSETESYPSASASVQKQGDKFIVNGMKVSCINGRHASWYFLLAKDLSNGRNSALVFKADLPGITRGAEAAKLGKRCADICLVDFENLELNESNLLGSFGEGDEVLLESNCISAPLLAAHAAGLIRNALENSIRYSKERETFGKPIGKHQAIGFMLADMAKNAECARLMSWKAASLFDQGIKDPLQALSARAFAIDAAMAAATDAVQIYGGYGYSKEYPVERLMRDAKMMQMLAGSSLEIKCRIAEEQLALI